MGRARTDARAIAGSAPALGLRFLAGLVLAPAACRRFLQDVAAGAHLSLPPSALRALWGGGEDARRLLAGALLVWPLAAALLSAATLAMLGSAAEAVLWGTVYGVLLGGAGTAVVSATLGLGSAAPGGFAIAPAFGLAFAVALEKAGGMEAFAAAFQQLNAVAAIGAGPAGVVALGPLAGAIVSVGVGISGYFAGSPFLERAECSPSRQVAGAVIGVAASTATYGLAVAAALWIDRSGASVALVCALLGGLVGAGLACTMLLRGFRARSALAMAAAIALPWTIVAWLARDPLLATPPPLWPRECARRVSTPRFSPCPSRQPNATAERRPGRSRARPAAAALLWPSWVRFAMTSRCPRR